VTKALETRTPASKPNTLADMPPHAGPLGRLNIPYDPVQYRDFLEWLYSKHKSQPSGSLIDAQQYADIVQFLEREQTDQKGQKGTKGQLQTSKWRHRIRQQNYVLQGVEGEQQVYKAVPKSDDVSTGLLRLLQIHDIPKVLHDIHVSTLGHAGQDKTVDEVRLGKGNVAQ